MGNIFSQYLQPVRSITERMADLDAQDIRREQLAGTRQQNALQALAMQRDEQARAEAQRDKVVLQQLAGQSGGDQNALIRALRGSGRIALMGQADAIEKALLERQNKEAAIRKTDVEADKERLAMARTKADAVLQAVSAARDPASYAQALQWLGSQGIETANLPQQYDPRFVQTSGQQAMTIKDRLDQEWKAKGYDLDVRKQGEVERQNRAQIAVQMRGQNMADARSRESNEVNKQAARVQVMDTPDGVVLIDKGTGLVRPAARMDGKPIAGKEKALTESQAKAASFLGQMRASEETLGQIQPNQENLLEQANVAMAASPVNILASSKGQQTRQAQEQWAEAFLRYKTGAAATEGEVKRNVRTFFPQMGDTQAVIDQKARMREQAVADIAISAGPGASKVNVVPSIRDRSKQAGGASDLAGFKIIGVK